MHSLPNIYAQTQQSLFSDSFQRQKGLNFWFSLFADLTTKASELKHLQRLDRSGA